jgi:Domain of unknown function (DUF4157)
MKPEVSAAALPAFMRASQAPTAAAERHLLALPTSPPARPSASGHLPMSPAVPLHAPEAGPLAARKQEASAPGHVLPPDVKNAIESSYSISLDNVEFHADSHAQAATAAFSARAFAYGKHIFLGRNEKLKDLQLIAHEAAHVVQQQSVPTVLRWSPGQSDALETEAHQAAAAVMRGEKFAITGRVGQPRVQRWSPLKWVREHVADLAYNIPGYRLLTVLIGKDPITSADVDRSVANILRGMVELVPGGHLIEEALDKYHVFDTIGKWIEGEIQKMYDVGHAIKKDWDDFVDDLGLTDIAHPIRVVEDALGVFKRAIVRITKFVLDVISDILEMLKKAILVPLAALIKSAVSADKWALLTAVLGKDPVTGEKVDGGPEAMIGGFMKLIGQEEVWNNLKKANAVARAWAWFKGTVKELIGFVTQIPSLFIQALKSFTIDDIINLPQAVGRVLKLFLDFGLKFVAWAGQKVWDLLEIIFDVVAPGAMPYLKRVGAAIREIFKHPIVFVGHLVDAGKLGFHLFKEHFAEHLKKSFFEWLTKSLPGVYIPKSFELRELIKFVLSVLGLTWENLRAKLVKVAGEPAVKAMETGFDIVVTLVKEGPAAAWDKIVEQLSNLQDTVVKAIMDFVVVTVVQRAVTQIAALLVPGGAFIQAIIAIYDTIKVFIERLSKIIEVAKAFLDSLMEIVSGKIAGAAKKVEDTLAGMLTLAISFLAGFLHLGSLAEKVMGIIEKIRGTVDKALDKVIDWVMTMAKKLWSSVKTTAQSVLDWWKMKQAFKADDGSSHTLLFKGEGDQAQLVFETTPTQLLPFLSTIQKPNDKQKKLIADIGADIANIDRIKTVKKKDPTPAEQALTVQNRDAVAACLLRISNNLGVLLGKDDWGTADKPLPISYPKPPIAAYRTLYFGPKTKKTVSQELLETCQTNEKARKDLAQQLEPTDASARKKWEREGSIQTFTPTGAPKPLPEGGGPLGVSSTFQTYVGKKFMLPKKPPGGTPGGYVINDELRPYGYDGATQKTDGDHVLEIQLGGKNLLENLWPLDKRINQQAGSRLNNAKIPTPGGNPVTMDDLKQKAQKGSEVWLVIALTEN